MTRNNIIILFILALGLSACSSHEPFMGAQIVTGGTTYIERWYLKPEYKRKDIPKGLALYGAGAQKVKHRFVVKYFQKDNQDSKIEIPTQHMWKIHHNGKRYSKQDDDDLFYYKQDASGRYHKFLISKTSSGPVTIKKNQFVPVQSCNAEGWCLLYESRLFPHPTYVKQSILYQDE